MAQFDVHRNPGRNRENIPYVVVVQSKVFDDYRRRLVIPLVRASVLGNVSNPRFNPSFKIERTLVVLHPLELVSVAVESLGKPIASLAKDGDRIIGAIDDLLMRG